MRNILALPARSALRTSQTVTYTSVFRSRSEGSDKVLAGLPGVTPIRLPQDHRSRAQALAAWAARNRAIVGAGGVAAVLVLLALPGSAQAQTSETLTNASSLEGVTGVSIGADGSATLTLTGGGIVVLPEGSFTLGAGGEVLLTEAAVAQLNATMTGLAATSQTALLGVGAAGAVGVGLSGGGSDGDSGGTEPSVSTSGSVVDGYVMNATVFRDLNGNGVLDVGEPNTTTDANGDFDLDEGPSVNTSAKIIAYGGTDISTGKAFTGQLTAPGDSEIITPLTTLVQARIEATGEDSATATSTLATALGLSGQDLLTLDPIAAAEADGGSTAALQVAAQVATVISLAAADATDPEAAAEAAAAALADAVGTAGNATVLSDTTTLETAFTAAAGAGGSTNAAGTTAAQRAAAASSANSAINSATSTDDIALVQEVVQSTVVDSVAAGEDVSQTDVAAEAAALTPLRPTVDSFDTQIDASEIDAGLVLSGTGRAGTTIRVTLGDTVVTTTVDSGTPATWSVTIPAEDLPEGSGLALRVQATETPDATTPTYSLARSFALTIDGTVPEAATDLSVGDDSTVNAAELAGATLTGTAEAGATVAISIDGGDATEVTADTDGLFSLDISDLSDGAHSASVTVSDALNTSAPATFDFAIDSTAPEAPAALAASINDVVNANDGATFNVAGTAEPGAMVAVTFDGTTQMVQADAAGSFAASFDTPADGTYDLSATATDAAGNSGAATSTTVTVDTTASGGADDVVIAGDGVVNGSELASFVITGTAEAGSAVAITLGDDTLSGTADDSGQFSVTAAGLDLADGAASASIVVTDGSGNASDPLVVQFTVDSLAPTAPTGTVSGDDLVGPDDVAGFVLTGTAEPGTTVTATLNGQGFDAVADASGAYAITLAPDTALTDGDATVSVVATDAAGNSSPATEVSFVVDTTAPAAPQLSTLPVVNAAGVEAVSITGTAEPGATLMGMVGAMVLPMVTADAAGAFSFDVDLSSLGDGDHAISVTATDAAGNASVAATGSVTLDTTGPDITDLAVAEDGTIGLSEAPSFVITGTTEPGASVVITVDGQAQTSVTADAQGSFVLDYMPDITPAHDQTFAVSATATDTHGNTGPEASASGVTDFEAQAPVIDGLATGDEITLPLTLSGSAEPGASVEISLNGDLFSVTAGASGAWSLTIAADDLTDPEPLEFALSATQTDAAGNMSPVSDLITGSVIEVPDPLNVTLGALGSAGGQDGLDPVLFMAYIDQASGNLGTEPVVSADGTLITVTSGPGYFEVIGTGFDLSGAVPQGTVTGLRVYDNSQMLMSAEGLDLPLADLAQALGETDVDFSDLYWSDIESLYDVLDGHVLNLNVTGTDEVEIDGTRFDDTLSGGAGDDGFYGDSGDDSISGGAGYDYLRGDAGSDTLDGGDARDTASWVRSDVPVDADLGRGTALQGSDTDILLNIENLRGSFGDDSLTGDDTGNRLEGVMGNDTLDGAGGEDTVRYSHEDNYLSSEPGYSLPTDDMGVDVNLATGMATDLNGDTDTLISIEHVIGSDYDDTLTGDDGDNMLNGGYGDDILVGGEGSDTLIGGSGSDEFVVSGHDVLIDFSFFMDEVSGAVEDYDDATIEAAIQNATDGTFTYEGDTYDAVTVTLSADDSLTFVDMTKDDLLSMMQSAMVWHGYGDFGVNPVYRAVMDSSAITVEAAADEVTFSAQLGEAFDFATYHITVSGADLTLSDGMLSGGTVDGLFIHGGSTGGTEDGPAWEIRDIEMDATALDSAIRSGQDQDVSDTDLSFIDGDIIYVGDGWDFQNVLLGSGDDLAYVYEASDYFDGGAGDDTLIADLGIDDDWYDYGYYDEIELVYSGGHDVMVGVDFEHVYVDLADQFDTDEILTAAVQGATDVDTDYGEGVLMSFDASNSLTLVGMSAAQLQAFLALSQQVNVESYSDQVDIIDLMIHALTDDSTTLSEESGDGEWQTFSFTAPGSTETLYLEVYFDEGGAIEDAWIFGDFGEEYGSVSNLQHLTLPELQTNAQEIVDTTRDRSLLFGDDVAVTYFGSDADETISFVGEGSYIFAEGGDDTIAPISGSVDLLDGGEGNDLIDVSSAAVQIVLNGDFDYIDEGELWTYSYDIVTGWGEDDGLVVMVEDDSLDLQIATATVDDVMTVSPLELFALYQSMETPGDLNGFVVSDGMDTAIYGANEDFTAAGLMMVIQGMASTDGLDLNEDISILGYNAVAPMG